jgi:hypothetical protein
MSSWLISEPAEGLGILAEADVVRARGELKNEGLSRDFIENKYRKKKKSL